MTWTSETGSSGSSCPASSAVAPFLGTMGNCLGEPDGELPFPPHRGGGNMDNRHLTEGSVLVPAGVVPGSAVLMRRPARSAG